PLLLLGGSNWSEEVREAAQAFAERMGLPVVTSLRRQDHVDNDHPNFCGVVGIAPNPALAKRIREETDLIVNIGSRLGEMTSQGYELFGVPTPRMKLVTVHPGPEEAGMVHRPDLSIACGPAAFFEAAKGMGPRGALPAVAEMRAEFEAFLAPPPGSGNGVDLGAAMTAMSAMLPEDAIVTNGAGNYSVWLHRFHRHRRHATQLAPTSGSMGYGTPAALAAALEHPGRVVVNVAGDGCFQMSGQELSTARQHGAKVITVICDNGMYGTIRMHQERRHPGRVIATEIFNPDFVMLAKGYGGDGELVERTEDFEAAFQRALAAPGCYLLHLKTDPEQITPSQTLAAARKQGEATAAG
ncbi:MAG: thiamine pyrophosphate-dependent enzyme, partial [Pseudomonadota bacterium]